MTLIRNAKSARRILVAACAAVLATAAGASAAIQTWNGGGNDDNWTSSANWVGGTAPVANNALVFDGSVRLTPNNNFAAGTAFTGISFVSTAGGFTLGGNSITLSGDIADNASGQLETINLGLALDANHTVSVSDSAFVTLNGVVSGTGFGITKTGNGTLTLGASNAYTGDTVLAGGTLVYSADNSATAALNIGITPAAGVGSIDVSTLDLTNANVTATSFRGQINNATASTVNIGRGKTLRVNGEFTVGMPGAYPSQGGVQTRLTMSGGGSLVVSAGANLFRVGLSRLNGAPATGGDPFSTLDLSGLSNFTFSGTNHFRVGNGNSRGELTLASTSNTITASQVRVGDSGQDAGGTGGSENNNGGDGILRLGAGSNVINTDTVIISRTKSRGIVQVLTTTGTLTLAGTAGGTSKSNITIGSSDTGNGSGAASQLFLAGHDVTVQGGIIVIGQRAGGAGGSARGQVTFNTGTFSVGSIRMGVNSSGTGTTATEGTFTLGGDAPGSGATGVFNVANEFFLAQRTGTASSASGASNGTFNINGGTANINADIIDASTSVSSLGANTTTINLQGGTLNLMNHAIGSVATPLTTINLNGGTVKDVTLLAAKAITLGSGLTLNASPNYFVDNSQSSAVLDASGLGTLNIAAGKKLQGGGGIFGNVVAASDSRITPGTTAAVDTLNFQNNLTLGNNASTLFRLSENASSGNDQINVAGALDVSAGARQLELDTTGAGPKSGKVYNLINYTGGLNGKQARFTLAPSATLGDSP